MLVERPEGKRPRGRPRLGWKEEMGLKEIRYESVYWIQVTQDRLQVVNICEHGNKI
jgi:hypothetical protein